jgi:hypothetical protein
MSLYSREDVGLEADWCQFGANELAKNIGKNRDAIKPLSVQKFLKIYGILPDTAKTIHFVYLLETSLFRPQYLLWTLSYLKNYEVEGVGYLKFARTNQRYHRDTIWKVINFLATNMDDVSFSFFYFNLFYFTNYFILFIKVQFDPSGHDDRVLVDATECLMRKPTLYWTQKCTYSGYKKRNTLKYEVSISEHTGLPLSYSGPYVGPTGDIEIFRASLKQKMLDFGVLGLADGGYQGEDDLLFAPPTYYSYTIDTYAERAIRRGHSRRRIKVENFFGRMKNFTILRQTYRHHLSTHQDVFVVVLNITRIDLKFRPLRREM